ncbi:hypothetical protein [Asaia astilbis]|uniref:hypothetical protein n=1 Tax=Asaia astilbis TaxID=610244 RepID=UPI00046F7D55|nr:hypothetical protein [Asaia astilbis]
MTMTSAAIITLLRIREWGACSDGGDWFREKFPQGGDYGTVMTALHEDRRLADATWLADKAFSEAANVSALVRSEITAVQSATKDKDHSGNYARIGCSGANALIGSSGANARIGSSGAYAHIGSSGNDARIGSSGNYARIGSSGNDARIGSSGYYARIGSSGNDARIKCEGKNAVVASAGIGANVTLGKGGCASLVWHDGTRSRFTHLYVGEDGIEAGVAYRLDDAGKPVRVDGED